MTLLLRCCYYFLLHCYQLVVVVGSSPSTFSSRSCWFIAFNTLGCWLITFDTLGCWLITFDTLGCWFIAFDTLVLVVGSSPSTLSSRLLVHRLRQSRLGCWLTAFNNLVSVVGLPPSTISALEALGVLSNILVIFTRLYVSS